MVPNMGMALRAAHNAHADLTTLRPEETLDAVMHCP